MKSASRSSGICPSPGVSARWSRVSWPPCGRISWLDLSPTAWRLALAIVRRDDLWPACGWSAPVTSDELVDASDWPARSSTHYQMVQSRERCRLDRVVQPGNAATRRDQASSCPGNSSDTIPSRARPPRGPAARARHRTVGRGRAQALDLGYRRVAGNDRDHSPARRRTRHNSPKVDFGWATNRS